MDDKKHPTDTTTSQPRDQTRRTASWWLFGGTVVVFAFPAVHTLVVTKAIPAPISDWLPIIGAAFGGLWILVSNLASYFTGNLGPNAKTIWQNANKWAVVFGILAVVLPTGAAALVNHVTAPPYDHLGPREYASSLRNSPDDGNWTNTASSTQPESCSFRPDGGGYEVYLSQEYRFNAQCRAASLGYDNLVYEAQLTIEQGDCGGLSFHIARDVSKLYKFIVCANGNWELDHYPTGPTPGHYSQRQLIDGGNVQALQNIQTGLGKPITLAIVAHDKFLHTYINDHSLADDPDSYWSTNMAGNIGLVAEEVGEPTKVLFTHVRVWKTD